MDGNGNPRGHPWDISYRRNVASNLIAGARSANLPANIGLDNVSIRVLTF